MKVLACVLLFLFAFSSNAQSIEEIRIAFHGVVLNPDNSRSFHDLLKEIDNPTPTVKAYQAVSEAMLAQVVWNPFTKLSQVSKYNNQMEMAIIDDADNIEIRFLRLAIESNLPSFLGMSTHMDEDLDQIIANLSSVSNMNVDSKFGRYIFYFLESTGLCDDSQIAQMKKGFQQSVVATEGY